MAPTTRRFAWPALLLAALLLRLVDAGRRPLQFDEGQIAYAASRLADGGDLAYTPVLHGPLHLDLAALSQVILGHGEAALRVPAALAGTALVACCLGLRRPFGDRAAAAAACALALSPTLLYYSRFSREELLLCALTLGFVVVAAAAAQGVKPWHPAALGALLAAIFGTKEAAFLEVPIGVLAGGVWLGMRRPRPRPGPLLPWLVGVAVFWVVFAAIYTQLGRHTDGFWDGIYTGPKYWADQHGVERHGSPPGLYLLLLILYELPLALLALGGAAWSVRRRHAAGTATAVAAVVLLAVYSFAGERFPWLLASTLVPLALLAGLGFAQLGPKARVVTAAAALAFLVWSDVQTQVLHPNDGREAVATLSTSLQVRSVSAELHRHPGRTIAIDTNNGNASPWEWYLRDLRVGYIDMAQPGYRPDSDVLIVTGAGLAVQRPHLSGYRGRRIVLRRSWPGATHGWSPRGVVRWWLSRRTWTPVTAEDVWIYERVGAQTSSSQNPSTLQIARTNAPRSIGFSR